MAVSILPGGGGGSGFSLGPAQNEFADDAARNTYATANATWLGLYNGNRAFWIRVGGAAGIIQRRNSAGTAWENVTGIVSGRDGNIGHQGRFEISIHTNSAAQPIPATPTGGTYALDTGVFTPPTGTTEGPTTPATGEDIWLSQAEIDPANQTGTVTPIWSEWVERSHLSAGITGLTAGTGLTGGGASGVVSVSIDVAAADFPTIPVDKGGTGATDVAAARAALAVLTQAEVDARAVARFTAAEKTKLSGLSVGGGAAVNLGTVTLSADRLTAAAPSGYSRYPDGTLLLFRVGTNPDSSWTGNLLFYIGTDRYDLQGIGTGDVNYKDVPTDTTYLAVVHNAVQLLGPLGDAASLSGATFRGAARGIGPVGNTDFVTKGYADANYGGTPTPVTAHDLIAGWSADTTITDAEITAGATSTTNSVVLPISTGSLYMFVWRADADGGDPSEVHIGAAGNSRTLFETAVARAVGGVAGQMLVSVNTFNTGLTGGETVRVI